jgi:hypothetical protein
VREGLRWLNWWRRRLSGLVVGEVAQPLTPFGRSGGLAQAPPNPATLQPLFLSSLLKPRRQCINAFISPVISFGSYIAFVSQSFKSHINTNEFQWSVQKLAGLDFRPLARSSRPPNLQVDRFKAGFTFRVHDCHISSKHQSSVRP